MEDMGEMEASVVTLNVRSIAVGTASMMPLGPILVSPDGFDMFVKQQLPSIGNKYMRYNYKGKRREAAEVNLTISPLEFTCFEYYFSDGPVGMNVAFLQTTEACAQRIRAQLDIETEVLERHSEATGAKLEYLPYFGPESRQVSRRRIMLEFEGAQFDLCTVMLNLVRDMNVRFLGDCSARPVVGLSDGSARAIVKLVVHACQHLNDPDTGLPEEDMAARTHEDPVTLLTPNGADQAQVDSQQPLKRISHSYSNWRRADLLTGADMNQNIVKVSEASVNMPHSVITTSITHAEPSGEKRRPRPGRKRKRASRAAVNTAATSVPAALTPQPQPVASTNPTSPPKRRQSAQSSKARPAPGLHNIIGETIAVAPLPQQVTNLYSNVGVPQDGQVPQVGQELVLGGDLGVVSMSAMSMALGAFKGIPVSQVDVNDKTIEIHLGRGGELKISKPNLKGFTNKFSIPMCDVVRCLLHPESTGSSAFFVYITPVSAARVLHAMVFSPDLHRFHDTKDRFNNCNTLAVLLGGVPSVALDQIQHVFARVDLEHPMGSILAVVDYQVAAEFLGSCFSKDLKGACMGNSGHAQDLSRVYIPESQAATEPSAVVEQPQQQPAQVATGLEQAVTPVALKTEDEFVVIVKEEVNTKCPYTQQTMATPVENVHCKHNYELSTIIQYVQTAKKTPLCPVLGCSNEVPLKIEDLRMNLELRRYIESLQPQGIA